MSGTCQNCKHWARAPLCHKELLKKDASRWAESRTCHHPQLDMAGWHISLPNFGCIQFEVCEE